MDIESRHDCRRRSPNRARLGLTLLEMVIGISASAVLTSLAVSLICSALTSYARSRDHFEDAVVIGQLAEQFRADCWSARDAKLAGNERPEEALELAFGSDERVVYEGDRSAANQFGPECVIRRTRYRNNLVVGRESYSFQAFRTATYAIGQTSGDKPPDESKSGADAQGPVILRLARRIDDPRVRPSPTQSPRDVALRAVVGRDHRFEPQTR